MGLAILPGKFVLRVKKAKNFKKFLKIAKFFKFLADLTPKTNFPDKTTMRIVFPANFYLG